MLPNTSELMIIFGAIVLLFGADKLPKLGGAIGESIKNFKKGIKTEDDKEALKEKHIDSPTVTSTSSATTSSSTGASKSDDSTIL